MNKLFFTITMILSLAFTSQLVAQKTVVDVAIATKDFSTLVTALKAADLVTTLQADGPFTVFAPTNAAFEKMDAQTLNSLLAKENREALANILSYHVVSGKLTGADVFNALKRTKEKVVLKTLNGQIITIMEKDGKIWVKDTDGNLSEILTTDIMGSNGVIHIINSVVMPK